MTCENYINSNFTIFTSTQPGLLVYVAPTAALLIRRAAPGSCSKTVEPTTPTVLTIWPFTEKACWPCTGRHARDLVTVYGRTGFGWLLKYINQV